MADTPDTRAPDEPEPPAGPRPPSLIERLRKCLPVIRFSTNGNSESSLREAIEELMEEDGGAPRSAVALHERRLISNILQLRDLPVVDIMVPRADIAAIDVNTPQEDIYKLMAEQPHSRLPVYKGDLDNLLGVVHIKAIVSKMAVGHDFALPDIMRDSLVVSPAMRVLDLLLQMRQSRMHIAFVVDEFGGIDGLITINDLIEAVVGEIDDEFDFEIPPQIIERPDGTTVADARYPIEDFEKRFGNVFSEDDTFEDVDTLGGLVMHIAGHVPNRGEIVTHAESGITFEILDADPRRVIRLRVRNMPVKGKEGV